MAKKSLGYVKLEWTCPNCSTRNPGPQKTCTNCGAPQPEDVKFEQAAQEELIKDEAEIARAKIGPDIHCFFCGARNPADAKTCSQCGGDLTQGTARTSGEVLGAHKTGPAQKITCPACGAPNEASAPKCAQCGASLVPARPQPEPALTTGKKGSGLGLFGIIAIIVVLMLCVGLGAFIFLSQRTEDIQATVEGVAWTRTVAIEGLAPVTHEDWRDEIPGDAPIGDCTQKLYKTQDEPAPGAKEVCGTPYTKDEGSGYGEVVQDCQYEVYADWCEYTVKEWRQINEAVISGRDLNPLWPQSQLAAQQREGQRTEAYEVLFNAGDGKTYTYRLTNPAEFARYQPGSRWVLQVNAFGEVSAAEPAE